MKHRIKRDLGTVLAAGLSFIAAGSLVGCSVTKTVYIQDATVTTPLSQPPIFVTNNPQPGKLRLMPHVSVGQDQLVETVIPGHSPVNSRGAYQVDTVRDNGALRFRESGANNYQFGGKNLHWNLPGTFMGVDGEYTLSRHVALTFGASYASGKRGGFWSGGAGLGLFSQGEALAFRFDGGVQWRSLSYDIPTVVVTEVDYWFSGSDTEVRFFRDRGTDTYMDLYMSCTINSCFPSSFVNFFVNGCLARQKVVDLTPSTPEVISPFYTVQAAGDAEADVAVTNVLLSPGLSFELGASQRALVGVRMVLGNDVTGVLPKSMIIPFVQFDVGF
jgi:hypothetical protein